MFGIQVFASNRTCTFKHKELFLLSVTQNAKQLDRKGNHKTGIYVIKRFLTSTDEWLCRDYLAAIPDKYQSGAKNSREDNSVTFTDQLPLHVYLLLILSTNINLFLLVCLPNSACFTVWFVAVDKITCVLFLSVTAFWNLGDHLKLLEPCWYDQYSSDCWSSHIIQLADTSRNGSLSFSRSCVLILNLYAMGRLDKCGYIQWLSATSASADIKLNTG